MEIDKHKRIGSQAAESEASTQAEQGQQEQFIPHNGVGITASRLSHGAQQLPRKEPLSVEKDSSKSSTMNDQMEPLHGISADLQDPQDGVSASDKEHESPQVGQHSRITRSDVRGSGDYFPLDVYSLDPKPMNNVPTTRPPNGSELAGPMEISGDELPQRPASDPVDMQSRDGDKVVPQSRASAEPEPTWLDCATQTVIGPTTFRAGSARPTSVPNFKSQSVSRGRRDGPSYPNYPDQSFAALQSQYYPPAYQPHPLRTRSSQSSHNASYSSDSSAKPRDFPTMQSGAKTVGNTPSQSPGLFSPLLPRDRPATQNLGESAVQTPTLHPTHSLHLQAPIETHKLLKDVDPVSGRKTLNDYELFEKLGSGQHGTVKLGRHLISQQIVAVKIVRRFSKSIRLGKHGNPSDTIKKEVAILKKARHPHVVSLLEVIDDDEWGKVYLVLEYVARGEIVWRKKTDKDVAIFEMKRIKREKAGFINDSFEFEELERFNRSAPARRLEKTRRLERQKSQSHKFLDTDLAGPYWSFEYGEDIEEDPTGTKEVGVGVPAGAINFDLSQAGLGLDAPEVCPQNSTPKQQDTPRSAPIDAMILETVTPESLSRQESAKAMSELKLEDLSAELEGTMYGSYIHEGALPDESLRWRLQDSIDEQTPWTEEEEEYMYVPCLTLQQIQTAFRQTVLGLEYLHFQGIIHRDIKPANLLWTDKFEVKISDFGVSYLGKPLRRGEKDEELAEADAADKKQAVELAKTVGTPAFYAPELCDPELFDFEKNPERPRITGQIDVWALGVTLYCMIFGRLPFVDANEMGLYEKIAREQVFIPRVRLRGVENSDKDPETNYKRLDDILEYEAVDNELRDLIERLLDKDPTQRISVKEIKHHPWVLRGMTDQSTWVDETDPSVQSQGKRIEISNEDVAGAVVPLTLVDRVKAGLRRLGSVVRGRETRKRTDSDVKMPDSPSAGFYKGSSGGQEGRRSSLRGDEQIFTALRASREGSEHPLSQSVTASPEIKTDVSYFDSAAEATADSFNNSPRASRPTISERTLSSAESSRTVKATVPAIQESMVSPGESYSGLATPIDASSSSSLGGIFHGAGRRFVHSMRSRERGRGRDSSSRSSRSSSADTSASMIEDPHASPSLAISSAIAAGHLDQPPVLREEPSPADLYRAAPTASSIHPLYQVHPPNEGFQKAQEQNLRRQIVETTQDSSTDAGGPLLSPEAPCPVSPDDELCYDQQHRATPGGVSSSDQMASGISEFFSHPSVPSVVSGASSFSVAATIDSNDELRLSKEPSPSTLVPRNVSESSDAPTPDTVNHPRGPNGGGADDDEAGYNGEGEMDSDSDDDMLMMGPKK